MRLRNLFDTEAAYAEAFDEVLQQAEDGVTDDTALVVFEQSLQQAEEKRDNVAGFIRFVKASIDFHKEEEHRLASRRKAMQNGLDRLHERIKETMAAMGVKKLSGATSTIAVQNNSQSALIIEDEGAIPLSYWKVPPPPTEPVLDREALKADLESGALVPGARVERGTHVRVR